MNPSPIRGLIALSVDESRLHPVLLLTQEIPRKRFDGGAMRFVEALVDAQVLSLPRILFRCPYRLENSGNAQQIGSIRAERGGEPFEAIETRLIAPPVFDVTEIGSAEFGAVGEFPLADALGNPGGFDPVSESASGVAIRLPAASTSFEFGQG